MLSVKFGSSPRFSRAGSLVLLPLSMSEANASRMNPSIQFLNLYSVSSVQPYKSLDLSVDP